MHKLVIIDYSMGNLYSVRQAMAHVASPQTEVAISADPEVIRQADRIIFPGQGAARDCMRELEQRGLRDVVLEVAKNKPFLGVCMGMQVLMTHSEENTGVDCLDWFAGNVVYFGDQHTERLKIPQMGWNQIWQTQAHPMWEGIGNGARFYFVHSYYVQPDDTSLIVGECEYGLRYAAVLAQDNVFAIQAHPEKSAQDGLHLLANFMRWDP